MYLDALKCPKRKRFLQYYSAALQLRTSKASRTHSSSIMLGTLPRRRTCSAEERCVRRALNASAVLASTWNLSLRSTMIWPTAGWCVVASSVFKWEVGRERTDLELYVPAKQQKRVIIHRRGLPHIQFLRVPRYRPSELRFSTSHKPHSTYMSVKYIKHIPPPTISSGRFLKFTELGWNATGRLFPNVCILPFSTIRSLGNNPAASAALIAQDSLFCAFVLRSGGKETNRMRWREVKRALGGGM